mgnify:CR=1 FL=1
MKARSLTCACLFTVSTLMLAAPAMAIKPAGPNAQVAITPAVQKAVQDSRRDPANVKRDAYRHPAQTLSFFGVAPGQTVIEITPGNGWYSEILAPLLHDAPFTFAHIAGPLLGGGFALAVSLGYDALLRDAAERERLIDSLVRAHEETAALQDELARTQHEAGAESERTRLARDLHDTIAQELSSVSLLARSGDAERLPQIDALAQHSLVELRRIVAALAPADLDDTALAGALGRMLDALAAETGIRTTLSVDERMPPLRTPVEVMFLRIAQSALANVRQHARAGAVQVTLAAAGERVRLTVADDGRGFDPQGLPEQSRSYGLVAMRSRLRELGGELEIDSIPGTGTTLRAEVTA